MSDLQLQPASVVGFSAKNGNKYRRNSVSSYWFVRKPKYCDVRMKLLRLLLPPAAMASVFLTPPQSLAADPGVPSGFYFGGHVGYGFGNATGTLRSTGGVASASGTRPACCSAAWGRPCRHAGCGVRARPLVRQLHGPADMSYRHQHRHGQWRSEYLLSCTRRIGPAMGTDAVHDRRPALPARATRAPPHHGNEDATSGQWRFGYALGGGVDYRLVDADGTGRNPRHGSAHGFRLYRARGPHSQYDYHRFRVAELPLRRRRGRETEGAGQGSRPRQLGDPASDVHQGYPRSTALRAGQPPGGGQRQT